MSESKPSGEQTSTPSVVENPQATPPDSNKGGEAVVTQAEGVDGGNQTPPVEAPQAPEKYEFKLNKDSHLLKSDVEEIEAQSRAQGLSQEQAQKMLESRESDFSKLHGRQQDTYRARQAEWKKEVESDREIAGPDGKMMKENIEIAHRGLNMFADDAFKKDLNESGLGNNPGLIRAFLRIGKKFQDDKAVLDGKSSPPSKNISREQKLFPTHFKENKE